MYKIIVYVPNEHLEPVKAALFAAGAGRFGDYDQCCWAVQGSGQFRPMAGANPYLGSCGEVETVVETRLELVCDSQHIKPAVAAMLAAHPYEEVAYQVFECVDVDAL